MLRLRTFRSLVLFVASASACGGEPPPPAVAPPPVAVVAQPAPSPTRWVFPEGRRRVTARMDFGDRGTLYVGQDGLRELVKGTEPPVEATTLSLEDFAGVLKNDKGQPVLMTFDGDVLGGPDPLGALELSHHGPLGKRGAHLERMTVLCGPDDSQACDGIQDFGSFYWLTTGRAALEGITKDWRFLRSVDFGASWQDVAYLGSGKAYGHALAVELDPEGNGLLLHVPQRVFVTHDDGATWKETASPGIGARIIKRDGADHLWLVGRTGRARLDGDGLHVTTDAPAPLVTPPPPKSAGPGDAKDPNVRRNVRTFLSGDRVVEVAEIFRHGKVREIEVGSAVLGAKPEQKVAHAALVGALGLSQHVAGYGAELVYLRKDDDVDPGVPTTTVLRSADYGATWREDGKLPGAEVMDRTGVDVAVGPGGFTFVTALCSPNSPQGRSCEHRQIRGAGAAAFEDMQSDEELTPTAFAFDRERVYALGTHDGKTYAYESPLSQSRFTRTHLLDLPTGGHKAITVDAQGTLIVLAYDERKQTWELYRRRGGESLPVLYVPLDRGTLAMTGSRGLLLVGNNVGWETADGGETWTRVQGAAANSIACAAAGCLDDDGAERVGWDLPRASAQSSDDRVAASPEAPKRAPSPPSSHEIDPIDAVCKPAGGATVIAAMPGNEMVDGRAADVRWASVKRDPDGKTSIVFGSAKQVRDTELLPAAPKAKPATGKASTQYVSGDRVLNDGVVAARYTLTNDAEGRREPIEIDLAWWSASTGRTQHHTLHKVPVFFVPSYNGFAGTPQIVDGGLLYQPAQGREVYFVHDDGKLDTLAIPNDANIRNAERLGKGWILADSYLGDVALSWSDDGKQWSKKDWGLDITGSALLALVDGKPMVSFSRGSLPSALFPLGAAPSTDPPPPVAIDAAGIDGPCDTHAATLRIASFVPSDERRLRARVLVAKDAPLPAGRLSVTQRVTHSTAKGTICTSAYILGGNDPKTGAWQSAFLYPDAKGWSAWWFQRGPDPKDASKQVVLASPLACEPGSPEAKR
jgi:hypothetical protein